MNVVNEKPAQPLDDTQLSASEARREHDTHRSTSRWSPWLTSRSRQGTPSSTATQDR